MKEHPNPCNGCKYEGSWDCVARTGSILKEECREPLSKRDTTKKEEVVPEKEHHLLCLGVMARCYEHVPAKLKVAIRQGIEGAIELGFPVRIPEYWRIEKLPGEQPPLRLLKAEDYHEDMGNCLFFHFDSFEESPDVRCGSPLYTDWDPEYWTHFIEDFDFNSVFDQAQEGKGQCNK